MPKSLSKVQKHIVKKRGGKATSLHENSRDSQRLRRAGARDDKIAKVSASRAKSNRPHLRRIVFFQDAAEETTEPFTLQGVQALIQRYIGRDDEELAKLKKERRPGRPSSAREDVLKLSIATEEREYETGYWVPDMEDADNVDDLKRWTGDWSALNTLKFVRISSTGVKHISSFPPKGES
ncbi:MAG: hypothetical protein M1819_000871 [Sarea resinae]|nr:MAG: hypothetical protein M1819_000871 [Sarea resinae]